MAWLYGCRPMEEADEDAACIARYDGAYAWLLTNVNPVALIPCKGRLGLWIPPDDILRTLPEVPTPDLLTNGARQETDRPKCDMTTN